MNPVKVGIQLLLGASLLMSVIGIAGKNANATELLERTERTIAYVSGGVGDEEKAAMDARRKNYNLWLTFASKKTGEYQADVKLTITDQRANTLFEVPALGPLVNLKLPPGQYKIEADLRGKTQSRPVHIKADGGTELVFRWVGE